MIVLSNSWLSVRDYYLVSPRRLLVDIEQAIEIQGVLFHKYICAILVYSIPLEYCSTASILVVYIVHTSIHSC